MRLMSGITVCVVIILFLWIARLYDKLHKSRVAERDALVIVESLLQAQQWEPKQRYWLCAARDKLGGSNGS